MDAAPHAVGRSRLQGFYTNKYEQGTPFERPDEFDGRRPADIQGEELRGDPARPADSVLLNIALTGGDAGGQSRRAAALLRPASRPPGAAGPGSSSTRPTAGSRRRRPRARERRPAARQDARAPAGRGPADSCEDRGLYDRCITRGLPGSMMPAIYGNSYQIVQAPGYVAIRYEMVHETRVIPLDGGAHVGAGIHQHMGDARGRWEGDTLVVETTNFRDDSVYRGADPGTLRLVERFTRVAPRQVEWAVTCDRSRRRGCGPGRLRCRSR